MANKKAYIIVVLITFCLVLFFNGFDCLPKKQIAFIENSKYKVRAIHILAPLTVPDAVKIRFSKKSGIFKFEKTLVKVIPADSATLKFITEDSLYIEFYGCREKLDVKSIYDLREDISIREVWVPPGKIKKRGNR